MYSINEHTQKTLSTFHNITLTLKTKVYVPIVTYQDERIDYFSKFYSLNENIGELSMFLNYAYFAPFRLLAYDLTPAL